MLSVTTVMFSGMLNMMTMITFNFFQELVCDANQHVKAALASVIMGLSPIMGRWFASLKYGCS